MSNETQTCTIPIQYLPNPIYCLRVVHIDDHRMLVEPACAAAISAIYTGLIQRLQNEHRLPGRLGTGVLLIVCGGISVTAKMLNDWKTKFGIK